MKADPFEGTAISLQKGYHLYTDGSAGAPHQVIDDLDPEPIGGWAYVLLSEDGFERENFGSYTPATNNSMEILAAIMGLISLPKGSKVFVYSDSAYLVNTMRNEWWKDWAARDWKKGSKETPNKAFWLQLIEQCETHDVTFVKVKGHDGDWLNERCDYLAKFARKRTESDIK